MGVVGALSGVILNFAVGVPARVSVTVTAPMCAFVLILGARACAIASCVSGHELRRGAEHGARDPVVVFGAGEAARPS